MSILKQFKKKFTLACMFWAAGTALAFQAGGSLGEYTAFTAVVLGLFAGGDVADKHLNDGEYHD